MFMYDILVSFSVCLDNNLTLGYCQGVKDTNFGK